MSVSPNTWCPPRSWRSTPCPLSANGKLDRKALPPFEEKACEEARPATELENALARIWERILQVPQVGVRDNFFELGGTRSWRPTLSRKCGRSSARN